MLEAGIINKSDMIVTEERTAKAVGSGGLDVFATPALIALAEKTAYESVIPYLEEGQSTVGTNIDIKHIAATPVGMKVVCETELIEVDSDKHRRLLFSVNVYDEVEKIAEGTHERFIIDKDRFMGKVEEKIRRIK
ncbi:MAG: thioesterase family protein [Eubacterium sp.]|nr:thioesterase family protein [Eubacterium sp.]